MSMSAFLVRASFLVVLSVFPSNGFTVVSSSRRRPVIQADRARLTSGSGPSSCSTFSQDRIASSFTRSSSCSSRSWTTQLYGGSGESVVARILRRVIEWFKARLPGRRKRTSETAFQNITSTSTTSSANETYTVIEAEKSQPAGPRWAIAANTTDLSGTWRPIVTSEFKKTYDEYLQNCSQSAIFRRLVLSTLRLTEDEIQQDGRNLTIIGKNPAGAWKRTLIASGADHDTVDYEPLEVRIKDPDSDLVQVEAWWEQQGTVHKSVLRGKPRVRGGEFETLRYLENENVLVTESLFHPPPEGSSSFRPGFVKWRFRRMS